MEGPDASQPLVAPAAAALTIALAATYRSSSSMPTATCAAWSALSI